MANNSLRYLAFLLSLLFFLTGCQEPGPGDPAAKKGVELYLAGSYEQAATELKSGLDAGLKTHDSSEIWTILGLSYDELDRYEDAVAAHKKALEVDPKSHKAWTNLGATYRHMNEYDQAEKSYSKALELSPNYPEAHASLGALYVFQDKTDEAIKTLEKAVELDGKLAVSRANLAFAYAKAGRFEDSAASLKTADELGYRNTAILQERIDEMKAQTQ